MNAHEQLEFRHLKYIIAVAETGTFTAAAARLHVSQSAISTQIGALEEILGFQIFDRENGNSLTTEGRILRKYGLESLQTREHVVQTLKAINAGTLLPLRLGFTPFVERPLLRSVTDLYRNLLEDCEILPETGDTDEVISRVGLGELHAAVVTLPIRSEALSITVLEREPLVLLMRADDPLAEASSVAPSLLNKKVCIFTYQRHHPTAYERLVEMFNEVGIEPLPCTPTMNVEHIQWMVHERVCYSLIRASQPVLNGLVTRPVSGVEWTIDSAFITPTDGQHPGLFLFMKELVKHFRISSPKLDRKSVASVRVEGSERRIANSQRRKQSSLFS